jgi:hypothetical protein
VQILTVLSVLHQLDANIVKPAIYYSLINHAKFNVIPHVKPVQAPPLINASHATVQAGTSPQISHANPAIPAV